MGFHKPLIRPAISGGGTLGGGKGVRRPATMFAHILWDMFSPGGPVLATATFHTNSW